MHAAGLNGPDLAAAERVAELLRGSAPLGVAFSGGVDSSTLLALAARALGTDMVLGLLGYRLASPRTPGWQRTGWVTTSGVRVVEVATHEGDRREYVQNGPDRCFYCKDELFSRISSDVVSGYGRGPSHTERMPMTLAVRTVLVLGQPPCVASCGRWRTPVTTGTARATWLHRSPRRSQRNKRSGFLRVPQRQVGCGVGQCCERGSKGLVRLIEDRQQPGVGLRF
jgi:hypothetical protein